MSDTVQLSDLGLAEEQPKPPKKWLTYLGVFIVIASLAGSIYWFVSGFTDLSSRIDEMQRVPVPGSGTIELDSGDYTIFYEGSRAYITAELINQSTNQPVKLSKPGSTAEYSFGGHSGSSLFGFTAPAKGTYLLRASTNGTPAELAVGKGIGRGIASTVVVGLLIFLLGVGLGIFLIVFSHIRRKRLSAVEGLPPPPYQASS